MKIFRITNCIIVCVLLLSMAIPCATAATLEAETDSGPEPAKELNVNLQVPIGTYTKAQSINEYIAVIYRTAGAIIISIAIIIIMIAGVLWMTSGSNTPRIKTAKQLMASAIIGVIIYLLSYTILGLVNSSLVNLGPLEGVKVIEGIDWELTEDILPMPAPQLVPLEGENMIVVASDKRIHSTVLEAMQRAANSVASQKDEDGTPFDFIVVSAYRDPAKQAQLVKQNCKNASCTPDYTCTADSCEPPTCRLSNGPTSCPHTTARAVDVWGGKNGGQCIRLAECRANKEACRENPCQKAVIQAMRAQGFCNLCAEPWHFEYPKMSTCCN